MTRLRKAAKAAAATQLFNSLGLILSFITVPLYLTWLGGERYGLLLTGLTLSSFLQFSDGGINWASMLLMAQAHGRRDRPDFVAIVRTSFSLAACSAVIVALFVAAIYVVIHIPERHNWVPEHPEFPELLLALGISVIISLGASPFYNIFIALQETHIAAFYQGCGRILGTVTAVIIASTGATLGWVYSGLTAGALISGIFAIIHCKRRHSWAFQPGSLWEQNQVRQQLRTGAKSLLMQIGAVLSGAAPIFAISFVAGPQFVPCYSIPLTLIHAPCGFLSSFSTSLQGGYGEAMGRGETEWIAETVRRLLRQFLTILCLLGCGYLLLAGSFIELWTAGKVTSSLGMVLSVFAMASVGTILTVFRYALTGINRHRVTSLSDLVGGGLSMGTAILFVKAFGYEWGALAVPTVCLLNSCWLLPHELKRALGVKELWPPLDFWVRWFIVGTGTLTSGWVLLKGVDFLPGWSQITLCAATTTLAFAVLVWLVLREETLILRRWKNT